jgi:pimeloyl-ACP methyl ester carboxylesterase
LAIEPKALCPSCHRKTGTYEARQNPAQAGFTSHLRHCILCGNSGRDSDFEKQGRQARDPNPRANTISCHARSRLPRSRALSVGDRTADTHPATPERSGFAQVNGIRLWYASFGHGEPVILVDGGLTNANYWGLQVRALAPHYEVIALDSRGHGRSTRTAAPFSYDLMSSDVLGLMDYLHIRRAALVGFSDGGIIGLDIAIHHPERLTRLFAFAANSDPSGVKDVSKNRTFAAFIARAGREYQRMSPTPGQYQMFLASIEKMWTVEPHFTDRQLSHISVPTWIVDGDHDEIITRENTDHMAALIPGAGELILPQASHFAFLQGPVMFNQALLVFLSAGE